MATELRKAPFEFERTTVEQDPQQPPGHREQYLTALQASCVVLAYALLALALLLFTITFVLGDLVTDGLGAPRPDDVVAFHVAVRLTLLIVGLAVIGGGALYAAWSLQKRLPK